MKTLAYIPLHYGREYLEACIKSIDNHVDKILILYTEQPSYGQNRGLKNPESKQELLNIVSTASNKIEWVEISASQENKHREMVFRYSNGYDLIMAVDADEIFTDVEEMKEAAFKTGARHINVAGSQWQHFWRSFNEVHRDGFAPTRFHVVNNTTDNATIHCGQIYHMGYAQSEELTRYKISVHGHKSIPGSWFNDKWLTYVKGTTKLLHPDSQTVWIETEPFDKSTLPQTLKDHKYYSLDKI
jgi:hypothetical protein